MGKTQSRQLELNENGVINSNLIVQEEEYNVTKDVKIILYLILAMMVVQLVIKVYQMHRREIKKQLRRNLAASVASVQAV